ncbi:MAG: type II secretion system GspH family protein [Patescibacteria group bacterium]|nr:type II secretion system GspH family protein [Patescibacteria group bacterium]
MKKTKKFLKGFTLIELLVVIAIIGILASVVLVTFPGTKNRAKDARIVSALAQMGVEFTTYGDNNGSYAGFATATTPASLPTLRTEIANNGGTFSGAYAGTEGCFFASLNGGGWFCSDSLGNNGKATTTPAAAAYCLAVATGGSTNAKCPPVTNF